MEIFTNQKIWKKIVKIILVIMCFQILFSSPVKAADDADDTGLGGKLMKPIIDLVVYLGDRNYRHTS